MNPARRPLIAGNWKMNLGGAKGVELAGEVARLAHDVPHVDLVIGPPFTALAACAHEVEGSGVAVAGQNLFPKDSGAFTGEVSAPMLIESGCSWVILGHSERRQHFGESDAFVAQKVAAALAAGLRPIVCVGETLAEREGRRTLDVIERQVRAVLPALTTTVGAGPHGTTLGPPIALAYEPVWAIGTGKNAGPAEAQEVHQAIRGWLASAAAALASGTRILYGGSVKPDQEDQSGCSQAAIVHRLPPDVRQGRQEH